MNNLYPQLMSHDRNGNGGSFDDYDSIVDEFSIGNENSDISSMQMSDVGEIIMISAAATAIPNTSSSSLSAQCHPVGSVAHDNPTALLLPMTSSSTTTMHDTQDERDIYDNGNDPNVVGNEKHYHAGDYLYHVDTFGIDNTDMSAILGLTTLSMTSSIGPSLSVDGESLLPTCNRGSEGDEEDQHSLPSLHAIKNDVLMLVNKSKNEITGAKHHTEAFLHHHEDITNQTGSESRQLGPLGDELSYVAETNLDYQAEPQHDLYVQRDAAEFANMYEDEEDDANDCILPNLITYSSRRSKCVTVFSTAFILGVLVFALVAVGVSYTSSGNIHPFSSHANQNNGPDSGSSTSISSVAQVEDAQDMTIDPINPSIELTTRPSVSLTTSGTSTAALDTTSSAPTSSPRKEDKPIEQQQQRPLNEESIPTNLPTEQPSLLRRPSFNPSFSSHPSSIPSSSMVPSLMPSASSQPSWPIGNFSTVEGDAKFYLMADGGSNGRFWSNKLEKLKKGHTFLVHLGSAIRAVDDCDPDAYVETEETLGNSPIPVYSIPGENDYPKCTNSSQGWVNYQQHMMNINRKYWDVPQQYDVKRQDRRRENFSFLYHRVLFLGLNMVSNIDDEWESAFRIQDNIAWVRETIDAYWDNVDAVFVMGYGRLLATENELFYNNMISLTKEDAWADKLFVYARRSSELDIDRNVGGNKNFIELRVPAEWPILDVRVRTKTEGTPKLDFMMFVDDEEENV